MRGEINCVVCRLGQCLPMLRHIFQRPYANERTLSPLLTDCYMGMSILAGVDPIRSSSSSRFTSLSFLAFLMLVEFDVTRHVYLGEAQTAWVCLLRLERTSLQHLLRQTLHLTFDKHPMVSIPPHKRRLHAVASATLERPAISQPSPQRDSKDSKDSIAAAVATTASPTVIMPTQSALTTSNAPSSFDGEKFATKLPAGRAGVAVTTLVNHFAVTLPNIDTIQVYSIQFAPGAGGRIIKDAASKKLRVQLLLQRPALLEEAKNLATDYNSTIVSTSDFELPLRLTVTLPAQGTSPASSCAISVSHKNTLQKKDLGDFIKGHAPDLNPYWILSLNILTRKHASTSSVQLWCIQVVPYRRPTHRLASRAECCSRIFQFRAPSQRRSRAQHPSCDSRFHQ